MNILILNGVNLNMLGSRESIYGDFTYSDLEQYVSKLSKEFNVTIEMRQTNYEGEMVEFIHESDVDYILINPGAWTHYSYAIRDALSARRTPFVEVHITDIKNRELFRAVSVIEEVAETSIIGFGIESYKEAIKYVVKK